MLSITINDCSSSNYVFTNVNKGDTRYFIPRKKNRLYCETNSFLKTTFVVIEIRVLLNEQMKYDCSLVFHFLQYKKIHKHLLLCKNTIKIDKF